MTYKIILTIVFFVLVILLFWLNRNSTTALRLADKSTDETADRMAVRELLDAYASYADRKLTSAQAALFTDDAIIEVYIEKFGKDSKPAQVLHGRNEIESGIGKGLKRYTKTMHFNGQSTLRIDNDQATSESYTLAHHFWIENDKQMLLVQGIRYHDTIIRKDGHWLFSERKLVIDWTDSRPIS
jgi:hypothetical protein